MANMITLAYDGSLNGDWIARYALQLAAADEGDGLLLLHVDDGQVPEDLLRSKLAALTTEAQRLKLAMAIEHLPLQGTIARTLLCALPSPPKQLLLCGTRAKIGRRTLLAGTTAAQLLDAHPCPVLALRVVHPGLMGQPGKFLIPLAGHPRLLQTAGPVLRRLLPLATEVFLLRVMPLTRYRHHHLSNRHLDHIRQPGTEYLRLARDYLQHSGLAREARFDWRVVLSDDWAREVMLHCSHFKTEFALLGASERLLTRLALPGNPLERILHGAPCDLGIYRGPD